jgi:hypothetical protein
MSFGLDSLRLGPSTLNVTLATCYACSCVAAALELARESRCQAAITWKLNIPKSVTGIQGLSLDVHLKRRHESILCSPGILRECVVTVDSVCGRGKVWMSPRWRMGRGDEVGHIGKWNTYREERWEIASALRRCLYLGIGCYHNLEPGFKLGKICLGQPEWSSWCQKHGIISVVGAV